MYNDRNTVELSPFGDQKYKHLGNGINSNGNGNGDSDTDADDNPTQKWVFRVCIIIGCFIVVALLVASVVMNAIILNRESSSSATTFNGHLNKMEEQVKKLESEIDKFGTVNNGFSVKLDNFKKQLSQLNDLTSSLSTLDPDHEKALLESIKKMMADLQKEILITESNVLLLSQKLLRGRLSPASLDLDTQNCSTTFNETQCRERTFWSLSKTLNTSSEINLQHPDNITSDFKFDIRVIEKGTTKLLVGSISVIITNSGEQTVQISSIVLNLEKPAFPLGTGDAPGGSGKNWKILLTALENLAGDCSGESNICSKKSPFNIIDSGNTTFILIHDEFFNDIIAIGDIFVPPSANFSNPCVDATVIGIKFEFNITQLCEQDPIFLTELLRLNLLVTFVSGGRRGGICSTDANCNGVIDDEEKYTRTVQQRKEFRIGQCLPQCKHVDLVDPNGPIIVDQLPPQPFDCISLTNIQNPIGTVLQIWGQGNEGFETKVCVQGTVNCIGENCSAIISNTALLTGDGCDEVNAIEGSPSSSSFVVNCAPSPEDLPILPGDHCSYTQGGWGSPCNIPNVNCQSHTWGNQEAQPGCIRDCFVEAIGWNKRIGLAVFNSMIFPGGDPPDANTTAQAIERFLPQGGGAFRLAIPGSLLTNPTFSSSRVFGGQLLASTLNFHFSLAFGDANKTLALRYSENCTDIDLKQYFRGKLLSEVIFVANTIISTAFINVFISIDSPLSAAQKSDLESHYFPLFPGSLYSDFNHALDLYNKEFQSCSTIATGCFTL